MTERGDDDGDGGIGATGPEPVPAPPWRTDVKRRARRGAGPQLDRERIVARALEVVDAEGIDALSLRRLAEDLGVTPMALYWHVADKAELLELVGHRILEEVVIPGREGAWTDQLRDIHRAMFTSFLRHRNAAEVLAGRARFGPDGLAVFERILAILLDAGFTPEAAFDAYQSLYLFTLGFLTTSTRTPEFIAAQRQGAAYMLTLPADRFPSIRVVTPVIGGRPLEEQLDLGLEVVIAGIAARLAPPQRDR